MTRNKTIVSFLLVSAMFTTPAMANYFNNPVVNMKSNMGSAPNPTPGDIVQNHRLPQMTRSVQKPPVVAANTKTKRSG